MQYVFGMNVTYCHRKLAKPVQDLLLRQRLASIFGLLDLALQVAILGIFRHDAQLVLLVYE